MDDAAWRMGSPSRFSVLDKSRGMAPESRAVCVIAR
jgi:hypothetical protein